MSQNDKRSETILTENRTSVDPAYLKYLFDKAPKVAVSAQTRTVMFNNHVLIYVLLADSLESDHTRNIFELDVLVDRSPFDNGALYFRDNLITCHVRDDVPGFLKDYSYRILSVSEHGDVSIGTECYVRADCVIVDMLDLTTAEVTPLWKDTVKDVNEQE